MLTPRPLRSVFGIGLIALLIACGGDAEQAPSSPGSSTVIGTAPASADTAAATATTATTGGTGSSAAGGSDAALPACQLMTRDEAAAALGADVKEPEDRSQPPQDVAPGVTLAVSICRYSASVGGRSVSIGYERLSGNGLGQMRDQIRRQFDQSCAQQERITGLGDVACWSDTRRTKLMFLKGTTSVTLSFFQEISDPDRSEPLKIAAQTAAGRLP